MKLNIISDEIKIEIYDKNLQLKYIEVNRNRQRYEKLNYVNTIIEEYSKYSHTHNNEMIDDLIIVYKKYLRIKKLERIV